MGVPDLVFNQKIGQYDTKVTFIFDDYKESHFKKDLEYLKVYNSKVNLSSDPELRKKEMDLKFYKNIPYEKITFNYFKESLAIYAQMYFHILKSNTHLITSQEFNLQLHIKYVPDGDYYYSYGEEDIISDPENACFYLAGMWLVNNITIPRSLGTGDYSILQRYLLHELIHHHDKIMKNDFWNKTRGDKDLYYENKIKKLYKSLYVKKSAFFLNCLYTSLFNLREEGLADFNARKENPMDYNIEQTIVYNKNLRKLSTLRKIAPAEEFYEKQISYGNLTLSGEYANGRNMCMIIALAVAKQMNKPFIITIDRKQFSSNQLKISEAIASGKTIYISGIDPRAIDAAIQKIRPVGHYYFVKLYEDSCDILGIREELRIMTRNRFYNIVHEAITELKKEKIAKLTKAGFRYSENEIKET